MLAVLPSIDTLKGPDEDDHVAVPLLVEMVNPDPSIEAILFDIDTDNGIFLSC